MAKSNGHSIHRLLSSHHGKFAADLCLLWHGILENKKQPVSFYTKESRSALTDDVENRIGDYLQTGKSLQADRLARIWELMQTYIVAQNEAIELGETVPLARLPTNTMEDFLHLLYAGEKPDVYWRAFMRRHSFTPVPIHSFWDYFDEFQTRRMPIEFWLAAHARGHSLDLGAGGHSYLLVDVAADVSKKALEKNTLCKKKVVIKSLDGMGARAWPFKARSFDTIMLNSVMSYVKNWPGLLRSIRSTLKEDGVLLITNAPVLALHPASFFMKNNADAKSIIRALKRAGFVVKDESEAMQVRLLAKKK